MNIFLLLFLTQALTSLPGSKFFGHPMLSLNENFTDAAQKIFGYFDKSQLINLFELILRGEEEKVITIYRKIYDQGVEPKVFINDFLEILYYFKNINSLSLESTNFSLNDEEFSKIKDISNQVNSEVLILFWQFAISSLEELDLVSNQHISCLLYTSPSPRDGLLSRMPSSA